jgi:hypothetical protein
MEKKRPVKIWHFVVFFFLVNETKFFKLYNKL